MSKRVPFQAKAIDWFDETPLEQATEFHQLLGHRIKRRKALDNVTIHHGPKVKRTRKPRKPKPSVPWTIPDVGVGTEGSGSGGTAA